MIPILILITAFFLLVYCLMIMYYRQGWGEIPYFKLPPNYQPNILITVIIPARNEAENIDNCLRSVCNQSYPDNLYEVIVVDDHSTDKTADIVQEYAGCRVKLINLHHFIGNNLLNSYKKKAIEVAIQHATGQLIVTTDADCRVPHEWLENIAAFYEQEGAAMIAAPVAIDCGLNFIQIFQALDFMTLQGITGAAVHRKRHSMCNGANLIYEKKAFEEVGGFAGIDNIASGDDMLLMHKIANQYPNRIKFLKSMDAIVFTAPVYTIKAFFNQRIRWASKAEKYEDKSILPVLMIVYFFNLLLLVAPLIALFDNKVLIISGYPFSLMQCWFIIMLLKITVELIFLYPVAIFFGKQSLLWLFPVMQPFHIVYTIIAGWLGKFGTYQWKDRKVN